MLQYIALLLLVLILLAICEIIQLANIQRLLKRMLGQAEKPSVPVKPKSNAA